MITPVLLCGGSGTRLWPLSRKSYPKQFVPLMGADDACSRPRRSGSRGRASPRPLVLTNSDFRFIVTEQLAEVGIDPGAILIEPEGRNTAPAVLAAALWLEKTDPDALMLVAPSDHVVPDAAAFRAAVAAGVPAAEAGQLVTFGITPDRARDRLRLSRTGRGSGRLRGPAAGAEALRREARRGAGGRDGRRRHLPVERRHLPVLGAARSSPPSAPMRPTSSPRCRPRSTRRQPDLGFLRLAPDPWAEAEDISIDYAVMEKADNLSVVPFAAGWSDLGGWDAVWRESAPRRPRGRDLGAGHGARLRRHAAALGRRRAARSSASG